MAMLKNQTSELLWFGRIETTVDRAKSVRSLAEKIITSAIRTYEDETTSTKNKVNLKGETVAVEFKADGPKKLAARRRMMAKLADLQETRRNKESKEAFKARIKDINHPLIEKIFNEYAPKYALRAKDKGQGGGYTRIVRLGRRRGDGAEMAVIELV